MQVSGQVGPAFLGDGVGTQPIRQGKGAEVIVTELHGRFYEQVYRGNVFSAGMTLTSISNATFTTGTLGVTCTPIVGVWNPLTSTVNLVILQAILNISLTALQATGCGGFVWATSLNNGLISTGITPWNRKTMTASGSQAKGYANTALTAMTNNLVVQIGSALGGGAAYNNANLGTAAGFLTVQTASVENIDGSLIVPPGGVLALLATTTPVAHSAASSIVWEEVPL